MRRADNTIVFGSQGAPASVQPQSVSPTSTESMWFKTPVAATTETGTALPAMQPLLQPIGGDIMPERYGFEPRTERGLVFAAISLALIGVAAAGSYFVLGFETTARKDTPMAVSTTTVTNADLPAAIPAPEPTATPTATPADLPWEPPVVDAVKSPEIAKRIDSAQGAPARRAALVAPAAVPPAAMPAKKKSDMATPSFDDSTVERAGFPAAVEPTPAPAPSTVEPEPAPASAPAATDVLPDMQIKR